MLASSKSFFVDFARPREDQSKLSQSIMNRHALGLILNLSVIIVTTSRVLQVHRFKILPKSQSQRLTLLVAIISTLKHWTLQQPFVLLDVAKQNLRSIGECPYLPPRLIPPKHFRGKESHYSSESQACFLRGSRKTSWKLHQSSFLSTPPYKLTSMLLQDQQIRKSRLLVIAISFE